MDDTELLEENKQLKERNIMSDLKWELRIRHISDFREEHIKPADEFIKNYKFTS